MITLGRYVKCNHITLSMFQKVLIIVGNQCQNEINNCKSVRLFNCQVLTNDM